jgi:hypothetical protein
MLTQGIHIKKYNTDHASFYYNSHAKWKEQMQVHRLTYLSVQETDHDSYAISEGCITQDIILSYLLENLQADTNSTI